ncbi:MAG: nucleotide kinase, partial [Clostridia bacterium]
MKQLILLGGPMGVGKSAVSEALLQRLTPGVYLDGDWCWHMQPFVVNDENKRMVLENITHVLRGFLRNTGIDYVIFCWVMHQEAILHQILRGLQGEAFEAQAYSLLCDVPTLTARI